MPIRLIKPAIAVAAAMLTVGCTQTGDFGRQRASVINDEVLPIVGVATTYATFGQSSLFNYTDDERTLRDLGWGLVVPNHAEDWLGRTKAELQRTEIVRGLDFYARPSSYYRILASHRYRSSDVRYARVMEDAAYDMSAIAPYMAYARRVREADRQRIMAARALPDINIFERSFTDGRIAQNERQVAWVKRAMLFRLYAYRYAVDRLMIETPSRLAGQTIERLNTLEAMILQAIAVDEAVPPVTSPDQAIDLMEIVTKA